MDQPANALVRTLKEKALTLALAESVTCGLAAHRISGCSGTSDVFRGSIVCYTPQVKHKLLKVPQRLIEKYSCESKEVTMALAKNLHSIIDADIYAAITGLASPGGSESKQKPVGTIFISVYHQKKTYNYRKLFRGSPLTIKKEACDALYTILQKLVK
jgi:nicotinamide-nucleotide amidase